MVFEPDKLKDFTWLIIMLNGNDSSAGLALTVKLSPRSF